jgi:2-oxo-4-hydroxy-4-carboxy-5-ureidoimidazoline decarboxylase
VSTLNANSILEDWNAVEQDAAVRAILPCNGSRAWAVTLAVRRPFSSPEELFTTSDDVWRTLPNDDWQQAFDSHPRLGGSEAKEATAQSLTWSTGEQSAANADEAIKMALAQGNLLYEARFNRIFLLCATGRSASEMLAMLHRRMQNDPAVELLEAAEQQRLITLLRLRKWLRLPALTCAELADAQSSLQG